MRILVVDDEVDLAEEVCFFLSRRGHEAVSATGVVEAIAALAREHFGAVVTDMRMPDGSGVDVLRAANADDPSVLKVVITGQASEHDLDRARAEGARAICAKPFAMKSILSALAT